MDDQSPREAEQLVQMKGEPKMLSKTLRSPLGISAMILCLAAPVTYALLIRAQPSPSPPAWRRIETNHFSFNIPADMKELPVRSLDSSAWMYSNEKITLDVQYGLYPDDLKFYSDQPGYQKSPIEIDGFKATHVTFRLDEASASHYKGRGKYVAAVYFPDLANEFGRELTVWANCEGPTEQQLAKEIFTSIKFKRTRQ